MRIFVVPGRRRGFCGRLFAAVAWVTCLRPAVAAYDLLHLVDVPVIICPTAPGTQEILIGEGGPNSPKFQAGPKGVPDVALSFLRSSSAETTVELQMKDAFGTEMIPLQTFTLEAVTGRRLGAPAVAAVAAGVGDETCEAFWLSDGRSPADIPETWGAAREEFVVMCGLEGFHAYACRDAWAALMFAGRQQPLHNDAPLRIDAAGCERLMTHLAAVAATEYVAERLSPDVPVPLTPPAAAPTAQSLTRRLKGVGGTGYGRDGASLSSSFPAGHRVTSYGYSGARSMPMGRTTRIALVGGVVGGFWMSRMHYHGSSGRYRSENCDGNRCTGDFTNDEDLHRDDLMKASFLPGEFLYPFKLTIKSVAGNDYKINTSCPPTGWDPANSGTAWTPPTGQDLFVTFTEVTRDEESWCYDPAVAKTVLWSDCKSGASCCDTEVFPQQCADGEEWCEEENGLLATVSISVGIIILIAGGCFCMYVRKHKARNDEDQVAQFDHGGMRNSRQGQQMYGQALTNRASQQPQQLAVKVPDGCVAGSAFEVQVPSGQLVQVVVPPGYTAGDQLIIEAPRTNKYQE